MFCMRIQILQQQKLLKVGDKNGIPVGMKTMIRKLEPHIVRFIPFNFDRKILSKLKQFYTVNESKCVHHRFLKFEYSVHRDFTHLNFTSTPIDIITIIFNHGIRS